MSARITLLGLTILGLVAMPGGPARARTQTRLGMQDVQLYGGELFGANHLTEPPLSGSSPRLDNDAIFGGRYTYDVSSQWGVQLSASHSPSRTAHLSSATADLGLTMVDIDAVWNITPGFQLVNREFFPYAVVGVGYAWAQLNHPLSGRVGTTPFTTGDGNGYTANAGIGVKYDLRGNLFVDFDARYRYLSRLVNRNGQGLSTGETTIGLGYQF